MQALKRKRKFGDYNHWALLFTLPCIVFFILFFLYPAGIGLWYSFTNYNGINKMDFIGLENYVNLFADKTFYNAVWRTTRFTLLFVPLNYAISLGFACLMASKLLRTRGVLRSLVYWPTLLSSIMVGLTWRWIFGENFGLINYLLSSAGLRPIEWASSATAAFATTVIAEVWCNIGVNMTIFIGALQQVDGQLYEAAELDGTTPWQRFFYITLPSIAPTTFMVIITTVISAFKVFASVQTLTGGGPGSATTYMIQYIYITGFERMKVGYSSAVSMVMFVFLMVLSLVQMRINKEENAQ